MKRLILLSFVIIATFTACTKTTNNPPPSDRLKSILIGKDTLNMYVGETRQITVTLDPVDYHLDSVIWKSSDTTVLRVSQTGLLTAKKTGTSILTVSGFSGAVYSNALVTVGGAPIDSLKIGLIAYYMLNNNAADSSGNGHNGVLNGATTTINRYGIANSAYHFDGFSNNILVPDATALRLTGTDFTISAWVKLDQFSTANGSVVLSKRLGDGNDGYDFSITGDNFEAGTNHPGNTPGLITFGPGGPYDNEWGFNTITANDWYMVTIMYNASKQQITSYINGKYDTVSDMNVVSPSSAADMYIGSDNPNQGTPYYFQGSIDEVRIYGRTLTGSELTKLYNLKK